MMEKRLSALRGAFQCENTDQDITRQVLETYDKLLSANNLREDNIVSVIFSVTGDLDAKNPASALRQEGRACLCADCETLEEASAFGKERGIPYLIVVE